MGFVRDMLSVKSQIRTLILYPENGANPFYNSSDMSVHNTDIGAIRQTEGYQSALAARGDPVYSLERAGEDGLYLTNRTDKVVFSRLLFDLSKQRRLGYICIGIDVSQYEKICANILQNANEGILVYSNAGTLLARAGAEDPALQQYIEEELVRQEHAGNGLTERGDHIIFHTANTGGIGVYYLAPRAHMTAQLSNVLLLPIILLLAMVALLVPLSIFASNIISRPLRRLYESMEAFKRGDFHQQVPVVSNDEIGELSEHFNGMVREIRELVEKHYVMALNERQSELNALQAQINPHFLYNTLDSLFWRAQNSGNEELAEDIYILSRLFRLVLSRGEKEIPLSREVELMGHYLRIQKMRFGKRLDYAIHVDEDIQEEIIPKLILQPFVENAIVHGLESSGHSGFVVIRGERLGDTLCFTISDNGVGMAPDKLEELLAGKEDTAYASERLGRYAIHNVRQRLALRYEHFTLDIQSTPGEGTLVTIIIPSQQGE